MIRHLLSLLTAATALTTAATEPEVFPEYTRFTPLPSAVSANGEKYISCFEDEMYVKLFDQNLNEKTRITLPTPEEYTLAYWTQQRQFRPSDPTFIQTVERGGILEIDGNDLNISLNQAIEYLSKWGPADKATFNGETVIATDYFQQEYFGTKYISHFYKLVNGRWTEFDNEYKQGDWGNYGDWEERQEETRVISSDVIAEMELLHDGADVNKIYATQTFFNNDNKFEYIAPVCEVAEYTTEEDGRREGGQTLVTTTFEVKSQEGTKLMTLTIPEEYRYIGRYYGYTKDYVKGMIIGNKKYIIVDMLKATLVYDIDGTSGIKAPAMVVEGSMNVHPTLPRRGETVTVDLGAAAQPGCRIAVTAANGRNALNLQAKAGETSVNIPTTSLSSGMYIVTVNNGTSSTEAAKIIIR